MKRKNVLAIFVSFLLACAILLSGTTKAEDLATVYVNPPTSDVTVGDTFAINISITNVENLYGWQVKIYYNITILNCTGAWLPADHVFADQTFAEAYLTIKENYVIYGCCLIGKPPAITLFNGTGVLCEIEFKGISAGSCDLNFSRPLGEETFLMELVEDLGPQKMPFEAEDGYVTVLAYLPVHNIDTGLDYASIQEAINAAQTLDRHTILVDAGTYYEHVVVNKTVSLIGDGRDTRIDGGGTGTALSITASNVVISGFAIQNGVWGISLENSCNCTIRGNAITNNAGGIRLILGSQGNTVYYNNIINNTDQVHLEDSSNNAWDNGCEGNYWSNYNGTDLDGDGVGDEYLPWEGVDYYPLISPYILGDINHDGIVNMMDVSLACYAAFTISGHPRWDPRCDVDENGVVDMMDISIICYHFLEHV